MSRLLLDTHAFLWWRLDDPRLQREAREAIATADLVLVSAASAWEFEIKRALGRLTLDGSFQAGITDSHFELLPVRVEHTAALASLPALHRDPFDRMLVAQALVEAAILVSHDAQVLRYPVATLGT